MGKTRRGDKERSREQELKYENQKLRREVGSLRKQLARIDLDRHSYVRDIVEEHLAAEDAEETTQQMLGRLKEAWRCHDCNIGFLEIYLYTRPEGTYYYRTCNNCSKRTKSQRYSPDTVQGIVKNPPEKAK